VNREHHTLSYLLFWPWRPIWHGCTNGLVWRLSAWRGRLRLPGSVSALKTDRDRLAGKSSARRAMPLGGGPGEKPTRKPNESLAAMSGKTGSRMVTKPQREESTAGAARRSQKAVYEALNRTMRGSALSSRLQRAQCIRGPANPNLVDFDSIPWDVKFRAMWLFGVW